MQAGDLAAGGQWGRRIARLIDALQSNRALHGNAALLLLTRVMQAGSGFVLSIVLVRRFGLAAAGDYTLALVMVMFWAIFGTSGLGFSLAQTHLSLAQRNTLAFAVSVLTMPISLPLFIAFGFCVGHNNEEAIAIAVLACGAWYFAQIAILNALLVLHDNIKRGLIAPSFNIAGILIAAVWADSLTSLGLILIITRFIGVASTYIGLQYQSITTREFLQHLQFGIRFVSSDLVLSVGGHLSTLIISYFLTREQLGILGLCNQILGITDLPNASFLQAAYPAIVSDPKGSIAANKKRVFVIALVTMVGCMVATIPLSLWFYHVPELLIYAPLFLTTVPGRNLWGFCDTVLKAVNDIRLANLGAAVRMVSGILVVVCVAQMGFHVIVGAMLTISWVHCAMALVFLQIVLRRA